MIVCNRFPYATSSAWHFYGVEEIVAGFIVSRSSRKCTQDFTRARYVGKGIIIYMDVEERFTTVSCPTSDDAVTTIVVACESGISPEDVSVDIESCVVVARIIPHESASPLDVSEDIVTECCCSCGERPRKCPN